MKEQIQLLIKLQKIDTIIVQHKREKEQMLKTLEEEEAALKTKEEKLQELLQHIAVREKELRSKERKLQIVQDELQKYREKLYQIKTKKEMEALDYEIENARGQKEMLENKIMEIWEIVDSLKEEAEKEGKELEKEKEKFEKKKREILSKVKEKEELLSKEEQERQSLCQRTDASLLSLYEKLLQNKNYLAVVPVRAGACQGCHMMLPPQRINEIKENKSIIRCENCVRILYWEDEEVA